MANRFWVQTLGATWDNSTILNWATTTGGTPGASVPGAGDTAIFDGNSGSATITTNYAVSIVTLTLATGFAGSLVLGNNLTCSSNITVTQGMFSDGNFNVQTATFGSANSNTRSIVKGSGTWTITGSGAATFNLGTTTNTGLTFSDAGPTVFTDTTATTKTVNVCKLLTYFKFTVPNSSTGAYVFNAGGNTTFTDFTFGNGTLHTFAVRTFIFTNLPTIPANVSINSLTPTSATTFSCTAGNVVGGGGMTIQDNNPTQTNTWFTGGSSTLTSNTGNWINSGLPPAPKGSNLAMLGVG